MKSKSNSSQIPSWNSWKLNMEKPTSSKYKQIVIVILVFLIGFFGTRALFAWFKNKGENQKTTTETVHKTTNQNP